MEDQALITAMQKANEGTSINTGFDKMSDFEQFCTYYAEEHELFIEFDFQGLMGNNDIYAYIEKFED